MSASSECLTTGVQGLDDILNGGLLANHIYLIQGAPGVGKTTLALQFLLEGRRRGEPSLYVTLSETEAELRGGARSHGWSLDGVSIYEMSAAEGAESALEAENTLYVPAEVELGERIRALLDEVDRVKPRRIVLDSCSELRLLAQTPLRFRRQVLALKTELIQRGCTLLLLENPGSSGSDVVLQSLVHGVLEMEQLSPLYGAERRRLRVIKLREVKFRGGYHDFVITTQGVCVFPRLVAAEHLQAFTSGSASSGIAELDALLGGGLDRGTSTLLMGPAGTGKSAVATAFAAAAAERGEQVAAFIFDESEHTLYARSRALGIPVDRHVERGRLTIQQVNPAELSPGEFIHTVRDCVERGSARVLIIDSLNGYLNAMSEEKCVLLQFHELLAYLGQRGVITILVMAQHGLIGPMESPVDVSYLADSVVLLRYFEAGGHVLKAVSVVKKRTGPHERTIREFTLGERGITVGPPLEHFQGVLTGVPQFRGEAGPAGPLLDHDHGQ